MSRTLVPIAGLCLAALACLSPVHNDTWWHLAYGREMAELGGFGQVDRFSHTAFGRTFPNHQWLSQRVFYAIYSVGGLPLLTAFCAAVLTAGWLLSWRMSRGPLLDRLLVMSGAAAGSTLVWSIRPQVFGVLLLPLTVTLLMRKRLAWIPAVTLVWANLHGSVLLGLIAVFVWMATEAVSRTRDWPRLLLTFVLSAASTLATPLGLDYWPAVITSLGRSQTNSLHEWQPPAAPPDHVFFWAAAAMLLALVVRRSRTLEIRDRALAATALVLLAPATRSLRNVSPFLMLAGPALTALLDRGAASSTPATRPTRPVTRVAVLASACVLAAVVATAWTRPWSRLEWRPMSSEAAAAIRSCPSPLYNSYEGGGPIIWFVPGQRVFVDSRQDPFPDEVMKTAIALEGGARIQSALSAYGFQCAAVPPASPMSAALQELGWRTIFKDDEWIVLVKPV